MLTLQFLIVKKQNTPSTQESDDDDDDEDSDDEDEDPCVTETWKFITKRWKLVTPKLIISIIYDIETFFMNQRLLKSIISDLVKSATVAEGKRLCKRYVRLSRRSQSDCLRKKVQ